MALNILSVRKFHVDGEFFSPEQTFLSGQVFRYEKGSDGWFIKSGTEIAYVIDDPEGGYLVYCSDEPYFRRYFDLKTDYGRIQEAVNVNPLMARAAAYGKGIRILKQDRLETIISFLLSSNNNIERIRQMIDRICEYLGEKREFCGKTFYTFPTLARLATQDAEFYRRLGLGYRAEYLVNTVRKLREGFSLDELEEMSTVRARTALTALDGVGTKVADCILLFAFGRTDAFPVDTWMERVYYACFSQEKRTRVQISQYFTELFGKLSGYAQQYLFYYGRSGADPAI